jgi:hypothetical protein
VRPAVRIVFAPILERDRAARQAGLYVHGYTVQPGRTIVIDPRGSTVLETLVHELVHVEHPSWSEASVQEETERRMKRMTWKQKAKLYQLLGTAKLEGEA